MRILVLGAGATGGYFGGRLLEAGRDVTFLVRPKRAAELAQTGLVVRSRFGNIEIHSPATVTSETLSETFDLVLLSSKAYDLNTAMDAIAPAVGEKTAIIPLLNGMQHIELLTSRFGSEHVLGGWAMISAVLDNEGRIIHLNDLHGLSYGELSGQRTARAEAIYRQLAGAGFDARLSDTILQEMWEKWILIAALAGITCLMRAPIGVIVAAGAAKLALALLDECAAVAGAEGYPPSKAAMELNRTILTTPDSPLTASMLRDIESGAPIEGDQIVGDLLRRAEEHAVASPMLRISYAHLKAYELQRRAG